MTPFGRRSPGEPADLPAADVPALPGGPAAEPEIPELKKKEKERQGAGVPWYGGSTAGAPGIPLGGMASGGVKVGASLSARSGFLGSGRIAAAISRFFGGPNTFLGGLFASPLGSQIVLAGLLSWGAVLGVAGYVAMSRASLAPGQAGPMFPSLDAVTSAGLVIDRPRDRSLGMAQQANQGELAWDQEHPLAPKDEAKPEPKKEEPQKPPEPPKPPEFKMPDIAQVAGAQGLKADGFIKGLSNGAGGGAGGAGAPKLKDGQSGFNLAKTFSPAVPGARQKVKAFARQKRPMGVKKMSTNRARSSRAMGQLEFANDMSRSGNFSASPETSRQFETSAFDQGKTSGGEMLGVTDPGGIVVPPSNGFTDTGNFSIPDPGLGTNVTPYQDNADNAKQAGNSAGALMAIGTILMIIGMALMARGMALLSNHTTAPIGAALLAAGMMLMMTGIMLIAMGAMMAMMGKMQAQKVGEADGQKEQQQYASECIDMAYQAGKSVDEVCPNGQPPLDTSRTGDTTEIQEAVRRERESSYRLDGSGGGPTATP